MFSIYIHIPFCLRKCAYCDFFSLPVSKGDIPHKEYLDSITRQLDRDADKFCLKGQTVGSVYFGGGTPSLMPASFFEEVLGLAALNFSLGADAEISCEVNPATCSPKWFGDIRVAGVNRVSIGVQSFDDRLLRALGRIHSSEDAMRAIAEALDTGFKSVSVDLMYAIYDQSMPELEDDLRTVMTFQPQHISAYELTCERRTTNDESHTDGDDKLKQMRIVARMLSRGGWPRYEISNFAKPGFECRHNLNYWRYGEYLGLGAGATSFMRSQNQNIAKRWTQVRDLKKYIAGSQEYADEEEIGPKTAMGEFCFLNLRKIEGINFASFKEIFGADFENIYKDECRSAIEDGLLVETSGGVALTPKGTELSNCVFQKFIR